MNVRGAVQIKPEMLLKTGAVMLDGQHGVCLVPQHFHNVIYPDALDHANYDMVNKLEFAFAGGILLLTGAPLQAVETVKMQKSFGHLAGVR